VSPNDVTKRRTYKNEHRKSDNPRHTYFPEEDLERNNFGILDQKDETQNPDNNGSPTFHIILL